MGALGMSETPLLLALLKFCWLGAVYLVGLGIGVLAHELGHAVPATLLTRQRVLLQVGQGKRFLRFVLGRLEIRLSWRGCRFGFTRYGRETESRTRQTVVAAAGPAASLLACAAFAWAAVNSVVGSWDWIAYLALFVSNFRILIVAIWPIAYRPSPQSEEVWLSDSLDIWRMWRR